MNISNSLIFTNNFFIVLFSSFTIYSVDYVRADFDNLNKITETDFEKVLNNSTVKFHEYENANNLLSDFFGKNNNSHVSKFKTNFQDLSLQVDSKNLREIYEAKLLEMKEGNKTKDNKKWSFFNKKI